MTERSSMGFDVYFFASLRLDKTCKAPATTVRPRAKLVCYFGPCPASYVEADG